MRQTLRSALARRGRETVAWLAIGGTLAAMFLTAYQGRQGWAHRRAAAGSGVRDQLTTAGAVLGAEAAGVRGVRFGKRRVGERGGTRGSPGYVKKKNILV